MNWSRRWKRSSVRADADLAAAAARRDAGLVARYDELKRRAGKLDFVDLLMQRPRAGAR